jgi:acyl transferase domain-containing protein/NAD(P)-dependent dehydrogenase (short-subunit alcohol dehydrogenase family)/acyl carrier protein
MSTERQAPDQRELMRRAYSVIQDLEKRLETAERGSAEPIAIVGMDCRFPGGATSPDAFWRLLEEGRDAITTFPNDRRGVAAPAEPQFGGFLERIDEFDPAFFGITPREARSMDPQQRLLLETSWSALEHAGQPPDALAATKTGVFVGITTSEYQRLVEEMAPDLNDVYVATGNALNAAAGRISFALGLQGPCVALDTACSSSLVAVHVASRSLRARDCDLALAGGVNVIVRPQTTELFRSWGLMAANGRCKAFDAAADGFVRSEGCGIVVLRRLSDARAAGDRILAIIAGSAVNQDGRSSGLTVPNGLAQQALLRAALADARLSPRDIDYVEAHGTGTPIGDPIEIEALAHVLGPGRAPQRPLLLGAVKTNIGHTESASGVAGLIKVVLALQHRTLPAHLHFSQPSPAIPWHIAPLQIVGQTRPWPAKSGSPRIAGVSSFGFSGTNAHVIVTEATAVDPQTASADDPPVHVLRLSAGHADSLDTLADRFVERLTTASDDTFAAICHSADAERPRLSERLALAAASKEEARVALSAWRNGTAAPSVFRGTVRPSHTPRLAFLFTGQGSQHVGMGRELYESSSLVRRIYDESAGILASHMEGPLLDVLFGDDERAINDTAFAQPALFVLEYALASLWRSWGVEPDVVLGHSVGEIVAATVADMISVDDALRLIATRGRLMQSLPRGAMAAIFADGETVAAALTDVAQVVAIAAVNGPRHVVISGETDAVSQVLAALAEKGVAHRRLTVSHAFHSPAMEPMLDALEATAASITLRPPRCELVSNLTGAPIDGPVTAAYWRRHAREPVQFFESVNHLAASGVELAVELGPAPTLSALVERILPAGPVRAVPSLRPDCSEWRALGNAAAALHAHGARVDLTGFAKNGVRPRVSVPTTPFQRQRHWIERTVRSRARSDFDQADAHPLLGKCLVIASRPETTVWESEISLERLPYLADHRVQERPVVPATAYAEMVFAAAAARFGTRPVAVCDFDFKTALVLGAETRESIQVTLEGPQSGFTFSVHSKSAAGTDPFVEHVSGRGRCLGPDELPENVDAFETTRQRCQRAMSGAEFYRALAAAGNDWGPAFQGVRELWIGDGEACAVVERRDVPAVPRDPYVFHPALADACGHALRATVLNDGSSSTLTGAFVGRGIAEVRAYRPARGATFRIWTRRRRDQERPGLLVGDLWVTDETGALVAETRGATLQFLEAIGRADSTVDDWWYGIDWEPLSSASSSRDVTGLVIVSGDPAVAEAVAGRLREGGIKAEHAETSVVASRETTDALIDRVCSEGYGGTSDVVYLAASRAEPDEIDALEAEVVRHCTSVLHLAQALTARPDGRSARLWLVTRGAIRVADEPIDLVQAPLWGLGRSLAPECIACWGGLLDFPGNSTTDEIARELRAALQQRSTEDQRAFRGAWFAPRLTPRRLPRASGTLSFDAGGSFLITGGTGGLGLVVAEWLVDRGARDLVLVSRHGLPARCDWDQLDQDGPVARSVAAIRHLEEKGASVRLEVGDIGSDADVRRIFSTLSSRTRPLRAVVHAAGVVQYEPLDRQCGESFRRMFAGKLRGAWLLDREVRRLDSTTVLVLFSSGSSILSSPFVGAYAAANAFLDGLALARSGSQPRVVSINWGMWSEVGMVARFNASHRRGADQVRTIAPHEGTEALERVLDAGVAQIAVLPTDWSAWLRQHGSLAVTPFLRRVAGNPSLDKAPHGSNAGPDAHASGANVVHGLIGQFERTMGLDSGQLDTSAPLITLGLDSLMAVELSAAIERSHGIRVPLLRFLEGASAGDIVDEVTGRIARAGTVSTARASQLAGFEEGEL